MVAWTPLDSLLHSVGFIQMCMVHVNHRKNSLHLYTLYAFNRKYTVHAYSLLNEVFHLVTHLIILNCSNEDSNLFHVSLYIEKFCFAREMVSSPSKSWRRPWLFPASLIVRGLKDPVVDSLLQTTSLPSGAGKSWKTPELQTAKYSFGLAMHSHYRADSQTPRSASVRPVTHALPSCWCKVPPSPLFARYSTQSYIVYTPTSHAQFNGLSFRSFHSVYFMAGQLLSSFRRRQKTFSFQPPTTSNSCSCTFLLQCSSYLRYYNH